MRAVIGEADEFGTWLEANDIADCFSFEENGATVWLREGVRIKDAFCTLVSKVFAESGFTRVELPFSIPVEIYSRQPQHYSGLLPLTYRITSHDGSTSGFLRTTSETPFTHLFTKWMERETLPLRFFQVVSVFRYEESIRLRPLLRSREINPFIESYSALATVEAADTQVEAEINIYQKVFDHLCLPYLLHLRPKYDTFPEAQRTIAFDVVLPHGEVYQAATVHHLGESFGRAFNISTCNGQTVWQTSTGISSRALACMLDMHRDSEGVVLPFAISPRQIAISVANSHHTRTIQRLKHDLIESGIVRYDGIDFLTGNDDKQANEWFRLAGCVAVYLDADNVTMTTQNGETLQSKLPDALNMILEGIENYSEWLRTRAVSVLSNHRSDVPMKTALEEGFKGIIERPHCGNERCMEGIAKSLGKQGNVLGSDYYQLASGSCDFCKRPATVLIRLAIGRIDHH